MSAPLLMARIDPDYDVRDQLTVVLALVRRQGVTVSEQQFKGRSLADDIRGVRETLQALEGRLAFLEQQARG